MEVVGKREKRSIYPCRHGLMISEKQILSTSSELYMFSKHFSDIFLENDYFEVTVDYHCVHIMNIVNLDDITRKCWENIIFINTQGHSIKRNI